MFDEYMYLEHGAGSKDEEGEGCEVLRDSGKNIGTFCRPRRGLSESNVMRGNWGQMSEATVD